MELLDINIIQDIARNLKITAKQIETVLELLSGGCTVPFIARYRKEMTNALDEEQIKTISDEYEYKKALEKRKDDVLRLINEKGMLTEELAKEIRAAKKLVEIEDLYRPYKEKKKTKATEAVALGLEPLADIMLSYPQSGDINEIVSPFITDKVPTIEAALEHAKNIIAEKASDEPAFRKELRKRINDKGLVGTKKKKNAVDEKGTYSIYYEFNDSLLRLKPHQILALNRAENENVISVGIDFSKEEALDYLNRAYMKGRNSIFHEEIEDAIADGYKRLIFPSLEREIRAELKEIAEEQAIKVFGLNLKNLLLQAPMKDKRILGVDPAFRTGCKLAVIDETGKVLEIGVIYPNETYKGASVDPIRLAKSKDLIVRLIDKHRINIIAIGNGTASRETEQFIASLIKETKRNISYVIVSEAGASVYSASEVAKEEFPEYEVQERSAVSIARRIQDPLSELVKIEPKAIGVGQYQHDVTQAKLESTLDFIVIESVNQVGVDVNTASKSLLQYVSGLNKAAAANIVKYREENGAFRLRKDLLKVPKLGAKSYEQSIGFLRIIDGVEPLDATSIHPESYEKSYLILKELGITTDMIGTEEIGKILGKVSIDSLVKKYDIDKFTLKDIIDALKHPLRDIRSDYDAPLLRSDVLSLDEVKVGMELQGVVRNVVDFGAFVDVGLKNDGLLHISKIVKNRRIKHPSEVLAVGQIIKVYVIQIDIERGKLSLSSYPVDNTQI